MWAQKVFDKGVSSFNFGDMSFFQSYESNNQIYELETFTTVGDTYHRQYI